MSLNGMAILEFSFWRRKTRADLQTAEVSGNEQSKQIHAQKAGSTDHFFAEGQRPPVADADEPIQAVSRPESPSPFLGRYPVVTKAWIKVSGAIGRTVHLMEPQQLYQAKDSPRTDPGASRIGAE